MFWGVWGAFSSLPTEQYGYPDEMVYIIWSLTMLIPAYFIIMLAIVGSTLMVYGDEKRGEVDAEEQAAIADETSDASGRSEVNRPTV